MSWQNILKAPRKKQLTDDMREVARALLSLSDDKLEEGVVDFVKETNMKRSKILETLSRISGHLRSAPTETYFDEEPCLLYTSDAADE